MRGYLQGGKNGRVVTIGLYVGCCICNSVCNCKKEVYLNVIILKIYWGLPRTASNPVDVSKCLVVQVKTKKNIRSSMLSLLKLYVCSYFRLVNSDHNEGYHFPAENHFADGEKNKNYLNFCYTTSQMD